MWDVWYFRLSHTISYITQINILDFPLITDLWLANKLLFFQWNKAHIYWKKTDQTEVQTSPMLTYRRSVWVKVGVDRGAVGGGGRTVCRVCSVAAVACSCDTVQMCGKTQAPVDLASSWKASASSEVGPAFEVSECRPGYRGSESPRSVGKPALNLCCSEASETD